ncbi:MAG: ABC transporter ATP-binding protein [Christensenellaceae bacterium]|nr:ABC transporter ATP-binding protein [Christensenellaceae bacterium]
MQRITKEEIKKFDFKTLKRLMGYMKHYKAHIVLVFVCIILSSLVDAASSLFLRALMDDYIIPILAMDSPVFTGLLRAIITMTLIYLFGALASLVYNRLTAIMAQDALRRIRNEMFTKMQKLPIRYFDSRSHGDVMSLYTNDTDALRMLLAHAAPNMISLIFTILAIVVSMLYVSIPLTIITMLTVFLSMKLVGKSMSKIGSYFMQQQKTLAELNGYVEEMINGQKVIKVFNHEEVTKKELMQRNKAWEEASVNANGTANAMMPTMNALSYVQYLVVAIVGAWIAINGVKNIGLRGVDVMTLGSIASFLNLTRNFSRPVARISGNLNSIATALAGAARIFSFMDEEPETDEGYVSLVNAEIDDKGNIKEVPHHTGHWAWRYPDKANGTITYTELKGDITMSNVDFGYVPEKTVLHDINLYANPGQKIAFVGATGAGKTTITNLINRFYDISEGEIHYDGIDIKKIKKADLRRSLGIVLQDVNLFTGTVMENIRYGNPSATDEECIAAAKLANADSFIRMLPEGYDTVLEGNGSGLSQGQRQLISIARAAVSDPPVMILDEATSSIDTRTEALVQSGMDALMKGRTVFVIAHRLSTVRNSDVIMVLDEGRIIERGTHDDLIAKKGTYYQLYTGAFELE